MTNTSPKSKARRGRLFPEYRIPPEELARRQTERDEYERATLVGEQKHP